MEGEEVAAVAKVDDGERWTFFRGGRQLVRNKLVLGGFEGSQRGVLKQ